jgi:hypothetical protein
MFSYSNQSAHSVNTLAKNSKSFSPQANDSTANEQPLVAVTGLSVQRTISPSELALSRSPLSLQFDATPAQSEPPKGFDPAAIKDFLEQQQRDRTARAEDNYDFLSALGYCEGDQVFFRALLPKHLSDAKGLQTKLKFKGESGLIPNTRRGFFLMGNRAGEGWELSHVRKNGEPRVYPNGLDQLARWNAEGRGIYFVVNPGGERDSDITEARVLFWEADDLSLEQQADIASAFELSTESSLAATVQTKNSLHNYVRLTQSISVAGSCDCQLFSM